MTDEERKKLQAIFSASAADPVEIMAVEALCARDACVARVTAVIQGDIVECTGSARRAPGDRHRPEIGYLLAMSRAMESLASKIRRRANGLVTLEDNNREQRPVQLEKARVWREANRVLSMPGVDETTARSLLRRMNGGGRKSRQMTRSQRQPNDCC